MLHCTSGATLERFRRKEAVMLTVGDKIPALIVSVQQGSALPAGETLDLGETGGKWKILFYWPKDFTFVCPTEIIGYGELAQDFADRDAILIGASTDSDFVHHAWRQADERANALGIIAPDAGVAYRATFVIDPDNIVQHVTVNGLNVGRNPQETLRILDALQTDELCPCNWQEGEEVLRPAA
jgi:alkyl hydroperoxide reductase subunit AhpC